MDDQEDVFQADLFVDRNYTSKKFEIADLSLSILALHNTSSTDFDLTGQVVWPASHLLSLYFCQHRAELDGNLKILELGSGTGLGGLVAARLTASPHNVILTDNQEDVLQVLQDNINLNFNVDDKAGPVCAYLSWGEDIEAFQVKHGTFDIICGADVVFWPAAVPLLFQTAAQLLKPQASSKLVISYISRSEFSTHLMYQSAEAAGFSWSEADIADDPVYSQLIEHQKSVGRSCHILIFQRNIR